MAAITRSKASATTAAPRVLSGRARRWMLNISLTLIALVVLAVFLLPMAYGVATSLKSDSQVTELGAPLYPASKRTFSYNGKELDVFLVPGEDGQVRELALVTPRRTESWFIDPANPEAGEIHWVGAWRTLKVAWEFDPQWQNYVQAWNTIKFLQLLRNTFMYALFSTIGAVASASLVAYGFARFPIPGKGALFTIVLATIILPPAVTLVPTYWFFNKIGWVGTWLPLIVPAFFANGYNIFLLRQFFMGIPRELDEAATIDGASPFRVFTSIVLPQSVPALTAVTLFHFFYCWNDFFLPLVYLAGHKDLVPISVGLTGFKQLYTQQTNLIQAASLIAAVFPLAVFFLAQRVFMQGIVITGVDK